MNKNRKESEKLIYEVMDILDPSGNNKEFWIDKFSSMSDAQFIKFLERPLSIFFQTGAFKEPSMDDIIKGLEHINVPLLEEVYLPYKYKDKNGRPIKTKECLVLYLNNKRMKQFLTTKNHIGIDTSMRSMKTGQLVGASKGGKNTDREIEATIMMGLENVVKELNRPRADSMNDKEIMEATIKTLGQISLNDLPSDIDDSISKNNLMFMFLGAQLMTNLVNEDYLLPYTINNKNRKVKRVD